MGYPHSYPHRVTRTVTRTGAAALTEIPARAICRRAS